MNKNCNDIYEFWKKKCFLEKSLSNDNCKELVHIFRKCMNFKF